MNRDKQCEKLISEAFESLEQLDIQRAIKAGEKLKKLNHSSGFEVLALAYMEEGDNDRAIDILKEGIEVAPNIWLFWQLLGNVYSEQEEYRKAQSCYQKALECDSNDPDSIRYNAAIALSREEKHEEALEVIEGINCSDLERESYFRLLLLVYAEKINVLNALKKSDEALTLAEKVLKKKYDPREYFIELSALYAAYGKTLAELQRVDDSLPVLWQAIKLDRGNNFAGYLIRNLENRYSEQAKYFRLLVEGYWPESPEGIGDNTGFYTSYDVVAEDTGQALEFIKRYEPEGIQETLQIAEYEILEDSVKEPMGVYMVNPYHFFT